MNQKLKLSLPSYNEIAIKLAEAGIKLTDNDTLTIEKMSDIERPIDWRLVQVRKDCVVEALKLYSPERLYNDDGNETGRKNNVKEFLEFVNEIYDYVLEGTK
jgi:hypothetical protein